MEKLPHRILFRWNLQLHTVQMVPLGLLGLGLYLCDDTDNSLDMSESWPPPNEVLFLWFTRMGGSSKYPRVRFRQFLQLACWQNWQNNISFWFLNL